MHETENQGNYQANRKSSNLYFFMLAQSQITVSIQTRPLITDLFITDQFIIDHVHYRQDLNRPYIIFITDHVLSNLFITGLL